MSERRPLIRVTGILDHRAIDGADGAKLMQSLRQTVESAMGPVV